jgi:hypothetical protein
MISGKASVEVLVDFDLAGRCKLNARSFKTCVFSVRVAIDIQEVVNRI